VAIRNLDRVFFPRSVAVVGASNEQRKVGYTVMRNLIAYGFPGDIFPINQKHDKIFERPTFKSILELPAAPDLVAISTPAPTVPEIVDQCGQRGVRGIIILTAGFREVGPAGLALEKQVQAVQAKYPGLRIIGPNCLGIISPTAKLNVSFADGLPKPGKIAFLSQSGALCTAILDWAVEQDIGFSHFVSLGNMLDVGLGDMLDYLALDSATESAMLYVESIMDARGFMSAARAFARQKPIVAYKAGRFNESAQAAASHTGAIAGVDAVYEAAFQRAGIVRIQDIGEMFQCAEMLARRKNFVGSRLAIVSNAGGPGVMATDALIACRGEMAKLAPETIEQLNQALPPFWSHRNPVDVLGDASPERFAHGLEITLKDPNVDAALVILTPQAMTDATATAAAVVRVAQASTKTVLASWIGGGLVAAGVEILNRGNVPSFATPEQAVRAFMSLVAYARNKSMLYETPREVPLTPPLTDRTNNAPVGPEPSLLSEADAKKLLDTYGIRTSAPQAAADAKSAIAVARAIGYPVVVKIDSPGITHKTDVGGVALNLHTDEAVAEAFDKVVASAKAKRPDATILGVTVQPMVTSINPVELILGAKRDPVFGTVVLIGQGGVATELYQDRALELPPLNERLARRMLQSLRTWPLLSGYRGRPPVDVEKLIEAMIRFSYLVADHPEILEFDVNPLVVTTQNVTALDARAVVQAAPSGTLPYSHLAIRPYPDEFTFQETLKDGTPVTLRPIKPEDERMWTEMVHACTPESLWSRFRYLFRDPTHETATRFCYLDYDREMALVAEITVDGKKQFIGIGRLVADPDRKSAEYAVLVVDSWQGRGLGRIIMERSIQLARRWGVTRVIGETALDNARMLKCFRSAGFTLDYREAPDAVMAHLAL